MLRHLVKGVYPIQSLSRAHGPGIYVEMDDNCEWQPLTLWKVKTVLPKPGNSLGAHALARDHTVQYFPLS